MALRANNHYKGMKGFRFSGVAFILLLCSTLSLAQRSNYPKSIWVGLSGGMQLSRYQFVPTVQQNQHLGTHFGALTRIDLEKGASVEIGLNYVQTGWTERFDEDTTGKAYRRDINYLEMPILSHLYLENKLARVFVNAGPFIGYYLGDNSSIQGTGFSEQQLTRHVLPIKNKIAWGLTGGPGVSIKLGNRHRIELEGHIQYDFQDIWSTKREDPYGSSAELRFGAGLRYLFKL